MNEQTDAAEKQQTPNTDKLDVYLLLQEHPAQPGRDMDALLTGNKAGLARKGKLDEQKAPEDSRLEVFMLLRQQPLQKKPDADALSGIHAYANEIAKEFEFSVLPEEETSAVQPEEVATPAEAPQTPEPPLNPEVKETAADPLPTQPLLGSEEMPVPAPVKISVEEADEIEDVLLAPRSDRRLLSNVPDAENIRTNVDRRGRKTLEDFGGDVKAYEESHKSGVRYQVSYSVQVVCQPQKGRRQKFEATGVDISSTGMLLRVKDAGQAEMLKNAKRVRLKFKIEPGTMPEGYEMPVRTRAWMVRQTADSEGQPLCGLEFSETLAEYANRTRGRYMLTVSGVLLFVISLFVVLMRAESVIYFEFNKYFYFYSIVAAIFLLSRYFFGARYKPVPIDPEYTPGVTIIIPCFNEAKWIERTITSCLNQDYPVDKLEIIVVDDHSSDESAQAIQQAVERIYKEGDRFKTRERVSFVVQEKNAGKREALARGALMAKHELLVFVDSDSFLDPFAIRNLVQPFKDPKMGGVSGRTDVANTYTNALTKMQSVRYYIAFRIMKAAEAFFDTVTCLSGPLACYRKEIVLEHRDEWLNQRFLGQKATFGDDRSMTNFVLKKHRTGYQDTAICSTIVPNRYNVFLKQQMRWKRSWLRESILAGKFMWKKEPFASLLFYIGLLVPVAAPLIVVYNLIYVPIAHRVFPLTFLVGLLMMSLLMSFAQLFFRKSSTWAFGLLFCLFYEGVLLWQMPVAWFTFWKSTWGTRMTPEDVKAEQKREAKQRKKNKRKGAGTTPQSSG